MKTAVYKAAERNNNLTLEHDDRSANQSECERYDQVIRICFDLGFNATMWAKACSTQTELYITLDCRNEVKLNSSMKWK